MPEPTTERIAALLAAELYEAVMEVSADEWTRWEFLTEFRREPFLKEGRRIFGQLVEAGVGFVAEAIAEQEAEYPHFRGFVQKQWDEQVARAERAEAALADLRARVRALADEMDRAQSPLLHIAADLLRALLTEADQ